MSLHHFNYITDMLQSALAQAQVVRVRGRVVQVMGTIIRAVIPSVKIGEICHLLTGFAAGPNTNIPDNRTLV